MDVIQLVQNTGVLYSRTPLILFLTIILSFKRCKQALAGEKLFIKAV